MSRLGDNVFVRSSLHGSCRKFILLLGCVSMLSSMIAHDVYAKKNAYHYTMSPEELVSYYRDLRSGRHPVLTESSSDSIPSHKCGLWITAQLLSQWKNLTVIQREEIQTLIRRSSLQNNIVIGHFHIFYDTSGPNTPTLFDGTGTKIGDALAYVDSVGAIFNHVWDVEIRTLGFQKPPFESGDSCYNISISDRGNGDYGITNPTELISGTQIPERYSSNIDIDNDFIGSEYSAKGIQALRVTAAHEFHHAVQIGSYGLWSDDIYAYEITSTWMEDVVYTDVNDYYHYLKDYFNFFSSGLSFNYYDLYHGGYERCIWAHYLAKRFGIDIMRDVWTRMRSQPFLTSTDAALVNVGSNLKEAFAEFTYWNYFTADRADTVKYYSEGNYYPRFQPLQKTAFYNGDATIGGDISPFSSSMYEFEIPNDTLTAIIANIDVNNAINNNTTRQRIDITLSSQSLARPYYRFKNGLNAKINLGDTVVWRSMFSQESIRMDTSIIKQNTPCIEAAPNPFRLAEAKELLLPINADNASNASVFFYSSSLDLVYSGESIITYRLGKLVIVVTTSKIKSQLSSGIYFVVARTKNKDYQWKVAVIR